MIRHVSIGFPEYVDWEFPYWVFFVKREEKLSYDQHGVIKNMGFGNLLLTTLLARNFCFWVKTLRKNLLVENMVFIADRL